MPDEAAEVDMGTVDVAERRKISVGGYISEQLPAIRAVDPDLASKIVDTREGDSHLFSEDELGRLWDVLAQPSGEDSQGVKVLNGNLLSGYAGQRWGENGGGATSVKITTEPSGRVNRHQENLAAMFWWRFAGATPQERDFNRLRFYMNMSREEAERHANEILVGKDKDTRYEIKPQTY